MVRIKYLPFQGDRGQNQNVSATASSSSVSINGSSRAIRFVNAGSNICYVRLDFDSATATTSDTPVLPGESLIIAKGSENVVGYISASGTTLSIQTGYSTNQGESVVIVPEYGVFDISGLDPYFWLDPSDATKIVESGNVLETLEDLTSNGFDFTQSTPGNRPATGTRQINSKNAIDYNGTDQWINNDTLAADFNGTDKRFAFAFVYQTDAATTSQSAISLGNSASDNGYTSLGIDSSGQNRIERRDDALSLTQIDVSASDTDQHVCVVIYDGEALRIYVDGVLESDQNITSTEMTVNQMTIGALRRSTNSNFFDGLVGEFVGFKVPNDAPREIDLIFAHGQSNEQGLGTKADSPIVAIGKAYEFRDDRLYNLLDPVGNSNDGSYKPAFANSFFAASGRACVFVPRAIGGTGLIFESTGNASLTWEKGSSNIYQPAVDAFNAARAWILANTDFTIRNQYAVWIQGESDGDAVNGTTVTGAIYETKLKEHITNLENDITGGIDAFFISELGQLNDSTKLAEYAEIRQAQNDTATDVTKCEIMFDGAKDFPADTGKMRDNVHYNQVGLNELGTDSGTYVAGSSLLDSTIETGSEHQRIEGQLSNKWGVTLPTTHPYDSTAAPDMVSGTPRDLVPSDLSSFHTLWDASDSTKREIDTGVKVLQSKGIHVDQDMRQNTGASQPTVASAEKNGLDTISFDGSDDYMECFNQEASTKKYQIIEENSSYTKVIYYKIDGTAIGNSTFALGRALTYMANSANVHLWHETSQITGSTNLNTGQFYCVIQTYNRDTGLSEQYVDYVLDGSNASTTAWQYGTTDESEYVRLGRFLTGFLFGGDIGECILFDRVLSTAERQQIEGYIAWKWGDEAKLPGGHPYELAAPQFTPIS